MKLTTINVQIVRNLGNYESVRLGGEWTIDKENAADAFAAAESELLAIAERLHPKGEKMATEPQKQAETKRVARRSEEVFPDVAATDNRERVGFGSPTLQKICNRVAELNGNIEIATIEKSFLLSDKAEQVVLTAIQLNK